MTTYPQYQNFPPETHIPEAAAVGVYGKHIALECLKSRGHSIALHGKSNHLIMDGKYVLMVRTQVPLLYENVLTLDSKRWNKNKHFVDGVVFVTFEPGVSPDKCLIYAYDKDALDLYKAKTVRRTKGRRNIYYVKKNENQVIGNLPDQITLDSLLDLSSSRIVREYKENKAMVLPATVEYFNKVEFDIEDVS